MGKLGGILLKINGSTYDVGARALQQRAYFTVLVFLVYASENAKRNYMYMQWQGSTYFSMISFIRTRSETFKAIDTAAVSNHKALGLL